MTLRGENATVVSLDTMRFSDTTEGGTRVSYEADLTLKGPLRALDPLLGLAFNRVGDRAAAGLRATADVSEDGQPASEGTTVIRAGGAREEPRRMSRRRRIAIVGAGVSGLTAAHLLHARHDVTLFEAAGRPGGHACTVDVPVPEGGAVAVDVGFMVLNDRTYPRFRALLAELGIRTRVSDMSFSVSDGRDFEYGGRSLGALFANRRHLADHRFLRMVAEYARFNREARTLLASDAQPSLRGWLQERGFSEYFVERLLVPQASAVWSADPAQMWTFPARFLLEFFANARRAPGALLAWARSCARRDLLGGARDSRDVRAAVRALIEQRTGRSAAAGPVRVLSHPRTLGTCFNPVSFYCAFDEHGRLDAVVAEVTNTPRRQRHAYVLPADRRDASGVLRGASEKALHVSPFQEMARGHHWAASTPGPTLCCAAATAWRPATSPATGSHPTQPPSSGSRRGTRRPWTPYAAA